MWRALVEAQPDLANTLAYGRIYAERARVVSEFREKLRASDILEPVWQDFFERNKWIFGYGLNYVILKPVAAQPRYGGADISGRGTQKGDFLEVTQGALKFTVLVEIKRPDTPLLRPEAYRNGAWAVSDEVSGGVSQIQANCRTWELQGSQVPQNAEALLSARTFTVRPKGILLIGNLGQVADLGKRTAFQLYRRNILNPEILTFDELYERAKFILEHSDRKAAK